MIREFALDPEAVVIWTDKPTQKLVLEAFRPGSGRLPACLPNDWGKVAIAGIADQNRRKEFEVFIGTLVSRNSKRQAMAWNRKTRTWLQNALVEHKIVPFHAIVTPTKVDDCPQAVGTDLDLENAPWNVARTIRIPRDGQALASTLAPMLFAARSIIILDPVFRPEFRFDNPIEHLLAACANPNFTTEVSVLIREKDRDKPWADMSNDCERLIKLIPPKVILNIIYVPEASITTRLHNRFVLAEMGGVMLGNSIDQSDGQTNDLALMDDDHFMQVLSEASSIIRGERKQCRTMRRPEK